MMAKLRRCLKNQVLTISDDDDPYVESTPENVMNYLTRDYNFINNNEAKYSLHEDNEHINKENKYGF